MGLFFECVVILLTIIVGILTYYSWSYSYWKRKGLPYVKPKFPFGTSESPMSRTESVGIRLKRHYQQLKSKGHKHGGLYLVTNPIYLPIHPDYVKNVMSKDFQHFADRGMYFNKKRDPLSANLFSLEGQEWRNLRTKLTPTFTSGKMKMMFQTLVACSEQLILAMNDMQKENKPFDIKDILRCFTTDIIGSCAFGLECDSFNNPDNVFRQFGKKLYLPTTKLQTLKNIISVWSPRIGRFLGITTTDPLATKFFLGVVKDTVEYREKTNFIRKDFMQILINLKNGVKNHKGDRNFEETGLTIEEMAALAFSFFIAGFETSSTTMAFCLFELSMNSLIQQKAREEINQVLEKYEGNLTYDAIMEMKYLGQVVDETLRKHPPVPLVSRRCGENYKIPGTGITIEKNSRVMIPIIALHHDAEYYPNPDIFDPERFNSDNKQRRHPFVYIPFGEGPRICLGIRFGIMQAKVGLAVLLKHFRFLVNAKTTVPLEYEPFSFLLTAKGGIWLDIEKI